MLVFRDTRRDRAASQLKSELLDALTRAEKNPSTELAIETLLRAGELECGVSDLVGTHETSARLAARLTDLLARQCLASETTNMAVADARLLLASMRLPGSLSVSQPEGYAYYRLDPRAYAARVCEHASGARAVAVIGLRSIGTSLSAIVSVALGQRGVETARVTVRPSGHPWARQLSLDPQLYSWVRQWLARGAEYYIVDEGPGLSGSTFIAVAQALEAAGVPACRIKLVCSHVPNPDALTSDIARQSWRKYTSLAAVPEPIAGSRDLSAGAWRRRVFGLDSSRWPACWTQLERVKQLSDDERWLDKFEGWPPYCQPALTRALELADGGFAPSARYLEAGMVRYPWLAGRPAERIDLERGALDELAKYCAFRVRAFHLPGADSAELQRMLEVNVREAFGIELGSGLPLDLESPVTPDARMQPHKWLVARDGRYYKVDGHGDGDGHLLPGPCDACWDLAGAIVEWRMNESQSAAFVAAFEAQTRDPVHRRLPSYLVAYCAFRTGELSLAALSASADEAPRIARAYSEYRNTLGHLLRKHGWMSAV
jgi:hypothetical protein